jgi:hypothetical protein
MNAYRRIKSVTTLHTPCVTVAQADLRALLFELEELRKFKLENMPCPLHDRACCDAHCEVRELCVASWRKEWNQ